MKFMFFEVFKLALSGVTNSILILIKNRIVASDKSVSKEEIVFAQQNLRSRTYRNFQLIVRRHYTILKKMNSALKNDFNYYRWRNFDIVIINSKIYRREKIVDWSVWLLRIKGFANENRALLKAAFIWDVIQT